MKNQHSTVSKKNRKVEGSSTGTSGKKETIRQKPEKEFDTSYPESDASKTLVQNNGKQDARYIELTNRITPAAPAQHDEEPVEDEEEEYDEEEEEDL